nr:S8 family peptidase [candidate division Zixibacteria bacterium]
MKKILLSALIITLGVSTLVVPVLAGEIAPELATKVAKAGSTDKIEIIISLDSPLANTALKTTLADSYRKLADRHRVGMEQLESRATISQAGILDVLREMEKNNLAADIKSHWIINAVSARIAISELDKLAERDDVDYIFQLPLITAVDPTGESEDIEKDVAQSTYIDPNIIAVGADSAWAMGYDGSGRIVCSFDTGVKGIHPALNKSWKGLDGNWSAAWFNPIDTSSVFPEDFSSKHHGSHVMGTMVGYDNSDSENVRICGVAPGARWITAAVINIYGASIIDAFEWAADPDGDPNTINDIPDVINHSWGIEGIGCNEYFWQMIDNTEALGIVNIFSAGNEGEDGPMSLRNPADRAFDSLDCFAVGAIDHRGDTITYFSSRGPSDCDTSMIKPNVVAPGYQIFSSTGSSYYTPMNGTSMAAPHVSGAVAILRQYAPDATVDEIKEALLAGCRRLPEGISLPNNDYGWGLIHIPRSLEALTPPPEPDLRVYSYNYQPVEPGETASGYVVVKNFGDPVNMVYGRATGTNGGIEVLTDSLYFGPISSGDTIASSFPFEVAVSDTVTSGRLFTAFLDLFGSGGYHCSCRLYLRVGESPAAGFYTNKNNILHFTISNFGEYGFAGGSFYPLGYSGFRYQDTVINDLFEAAFMIGNDANHISDGARNLVMEPDNDFAVSPGGDLLVSVPGVRSDQETFSVYNDGRAEHPLGVEITQRTYLWDESPNDNFVIMEYAVHNTSDSLLPNLYAGLFFDWNLYNYLSNCGGSVSDYDLGYIYADEIAFPYWPQRYRGVVVLTESGMISHTLRRETNNDEYDMSEEEKYYSLISGIHDSEYNSWYDLSQVVSTGPFDLAPGQRDTIAFAVVAANETLDNLINTAIQARNKYYQTTDVETVDEMLVPQEYILAQNCPNPFNPVTVIAFGVRERADVRLDVYNLLGRRVACLVDKNLAAGSYRVEWNGTDFDDNPVASGIYFYRMTAGEKVLTRKMMLLK